MAYITGNTGEWEYVIGLEVHAQVSSKAKLFSGAATEFGAEPNSQVSLVDAAMPGMLPVLNKYCVEQAIKTGLGINAQINKISVFDRKNYFYADLPQGYQISQFYIPIVENGHLNVMTEGGQEKKIRINRIHLEQDAGKSIHDQHPEYSLIDLNRSGIALMEIVTEPDISSPFEAADYVRKLRSLLRYIGSCDGNMEQGSMRCDANISVRKPGEKFGTRCEIKNLNSVKNITKAIEYEAMRQVELLESGAKVDQETRLFDVNTGQTRTMRSKEDANDYRYFPDPDLLPVHIDEELITKLKADLPELPAEKVRRYVSELGLNQYDAEVIIADIDIAKYFEEASAGANAKLVANWISSELFGRLNKHSMTLAECKITPKMLKNLVALIDDGTISGKIAKNVFEEMFESGQEPDKIVEDKGLKQVSDRGSIEPIIDEIIAANPESVEAYRAGKDKLFGFFVGQIMKKTGGKASPQMVNEILKEKLS
ncbi:MAG: Asp-tRNA(Asn)/Glu-tRNA(Gln) amidotransferase subunit GatB [Rickettsiaceae bacterium]|nr:Asp-tRNA(Asn)/Glu-tRNA(Gln) amidotransferase subunit GatB [Rickettsiaceae bacterium]